MCKLCMKIEKSGLFQNCNYLKSLIMPQTSDQSVLICLYDQSEMFQITTTKVKSRTWKADDDVKDCESCHKNFSVTIRKVSIFFLVNLLFMQQYFDKEDGCLAVRDSCIDCKALCYFPITSQCVFVCKEEGTLN